MGFYILSPYLTYVKSASINIMKGERLTVQPRKGTAGRYERVGQCPNTIATAVSISFRVEAKMIVSYLPHPSPLSPSSYLRTLLLNCVLRTAAFFLSD